MMKLACAVALALLLGDWTCAGPLYPDTPQTLCGQHLAEARRLFCLGATKDIVRKRLTIKSSPLLALLQYEEVTTAPDLAEQSIYQNDLELTTIPKRIGIVEECCLKPCSISELLSYC